jgi:hypothetical protein
MRRVRENGLSLAFGGLFLLALLGQAFAGNAAVNDEREQAGQPAISLWDHVTSSRFAVDVTENWQSEYLQFLLYILATIWLVQVGSPDSKKVGEEGPESDETELTGPHAPADAPRPVRSGGVLGALYSRSLGLAFGAVFVVSWLAQSIAGRVAYNQEQQLQGSDELLTWGEYVLSPDFWDRTLQNWQSEFLAVGSITIFAVYLRQRGSSESKPVGEPHTTTGHTN